MHPPRHSAQPALCGLPSVPLQFFGLANQIGKGTALHFAHHAHPMQLHGHFADPELVGDLLVHKPADDAEHHFLLSRGQRIDQRPNLLAFGFNFASLAVQANGVVYSVEQIPRNERLGEEIGSASFHCPDAGRNVGMGRQENDRHLTSERDQLALDIEAGASGHSKVDNDTARGGRIGRAHELRSTGVSGSPPIRYHEEVEKSVSHVLVIIDDIDNRFGGQILFRI